MAEECGVTRTTIYNWSNHSNGLNPWPSVAKHLHFGLKSSLYLYVAKGDR